MRDGAVSAAIQPLKVADKLARIMNWARRYLPICATLMSF